MEQQKNNEKIIWVQGNRQSVIIPMEREVIPEEGEPYTEDFYPAEGDVVKVALTGSYKPYIYTPEIDGNLLIVTDDGTLPKGLYGVQITVTGSNGETRLRSFWDQQIVVTECNNSVLKEWDEFKKQDVKARAAVFFFAKGDPFTYDDFTPEQIEDIKRPAKEAAALAEEAAGHAEEAADTANTAAGNANTAAGNANVAADNANEKATYAQQKGDVANTAAGNANTAAGNANEEAQLAADKAALAQAAATLANDKAALAQQKADYAQAKADYAQQQGDYAKQKADEIEEAKGTFPNLDARLDKMENDISERMERITEEQFNEIFN